MPLLGPGDGDYLKELLPQLTGACLSQVQGLVEDMRWFQGLWPVLAACKETISVSPVVCWVAELWKRSSVYPTFFIN